MKLCYFANIFINIFALKLFKSAEKYWTFKSKPLKLTRILKKKKFRKTVEKKTAKNAFSWERQQKNRRSKPWSAGNRFKSRVTAQTDSFCFEPSIAAVVQIDHVRRRTCIRVALKYYTTANCSSRFNLHRKQRTSGPSRCVKSWNAKLREEANLKIYFFF